MNDRLKRIAIKLSDYFRKKEFEIPTDAFENFKSLYEKQIDYFELFKSSDLIKLIFYIFSYKTTGKFDLAEKYLNNLAFATLFYTSGNRADRTCEECGGDGSYACHNCDETGESTCHECNGNGRTSCDVCNGEGRTEEEDNEWVDCDNCGGSGDMECDTCGGSGEVDCNVCDGEGYEICHNCDGQGEYETDELEYEYYTICTWNSDIKNMCELNAGTKNPAMSEYEFDRQKDNYVVLYFADDSAEFRKFIEENEVYCTSYSDEPNLHTGRPFHFYMLKDNFEKYIL